MSDGQFSLIDYVSVLRRRKWLVVVAVVVATGAAYFFAIQQRREYTASAQALINPNANLVTGAGNSASDAQARFDSTEAQIAHTPVVSALALERSGVTGVSAGALLGHTSVSSDSAANILTFAVTDPSPAQAARLVNAYATAFAQYSGKLNTEAINQAIKQATVQINRLVKEIDTAKRAGHVPAGLRQELTGLVKRRSDYEQARLSVIGVARVSRFAQGASQTQPDPKKDVLLGFIAGLLLGLFAAYAREAVDTRIRSAEEFAHLTGLKLLCRIPSPSRALRSRRQLALGPGGSEIEGEPYRTLRVAVDLANVGPRAKVIMVTSALAKEGKSTTAANLALAFAQTGRRVALVDFDLRRPLIASLLGLPTSPGASEVATGASELGVAVTRVPTTRHLSANGDGRLPPGEEGALDVLVSGGPVENPVGFLESAALSRVLAELRDRVDLVIIDTTPLLPLADAVVLSRIVDGVIFVARLDLLRKRVIVELARVIQTLPAPALGFVLTGAEAEEGYEYSYRSYRARPDRVKTKA